MKGEESTERRGRRAVHLFIQSRHHHILRPGEPRYWDLEEISSLRPSPYTTGKKGGWREGGEKKNPLSPGVGRWFGDERLETAPL